MKYDPFAYFINIEPITKSNNIFREFTRLNFYFYYFKSDQKYYLFLYGKKMNLRDKYLIHKHISVIKELDTRKRKLRSIRGFLLYALEIINKNQIEVLLTNLKPFFWESVERIIRQNNKKLLLSFLFEMDSIQNEDIQSFDQAIQNLENEIIRLRKEIKNLKQ